MVAGKIRERIEGREEEGGMNGWIKDKNKFKKKNGWVDR